MRTAKEQREIRFIYNKHNKSTKYKLEIDDNRIVFPENIRLIINKREKRTNNPLKKNKEKMAMNTSGAYRSTSSIQM